MNTKMLMPNEIEIDRMRIFPAVTSNDNINTCIELPEWCKQFILPVAHFNGRYLLLGKEGQYISLKYNYPGQPLKCHVYECRSQLGYRVVRWWYIMKTVAETKKWQKKQEKHCRREAVYNV